MVSPFSPTHNHAKNGTERKYLLIHFLQNLANKGISSNTTYIYILKTAVANNVDFIPESSESEMLRILWDLLILRLYITRFFFLGNKVTSIKRLELMLYTLIIKWSAFLRKTTALQHHIKSERPDTRFNEVKEKNNHTIITISQYKMALNSPFHLWLYLNSKPGGTIQFQNVEKITLPWFIIGKIKCFSSLPDWKRMKNHCKAQHPKII